MSILSLLNAPWAITPDEFVRIYNACSGLIGQPPPDGAASPDAQGTKYPGYSMTEGGTAVIPIVGVIVKNTDEYSKYFGEIGTRDLIASLSNARTDPAVRSILLSIDSPGGTVDGTEELGAAIFDARKEATKPVFAIADGLAASAAYWAGSAAEKFYGISNTVHVGSIGVITTHFDLTKLAERVGIKVTHIVAGKYKAIGSPFKALDREGEDVIQNRLDYLYSVFVNAVADHRGTSIDKVLANMADGRIFTGRNAVQAGLIDGIKTRAQVLVELSKRADELDRIRSSAALRNAFMRERGISTQGGIMTKPEMEQEKAELKAIEDAAFERGRVEGFKAGAEVASDQLNKAVADGAKAERERIRAIEAIALPGHEALIEQLKFDGKTTGPEAAQKVLEAEKAKRAKVLDNLKADAVQPVPAAAAPASPATDDASLPPEERAKKQWERDPELRKEFGNNQAAFLAFTKAQAAGRVRILSKARQ